MPRDITLKDQAAYNALSLSEKQNYLLEFARIAPSAHNVQPWFFQITDDGFLIISNEARRLTASDLQDREFYISLGACIGMLTHAFDAYGIQYVVELLPAEQHNAAALIAVQSWDAQRYAHDALQAVVGRHNNRFPFSEQPVDQSFADSVRALATESIQIHWLTGDQQLSIKEIVLDAVEELYSSKSFTRELSEWMRPSLARYEDGMPGYNIGVPFLFSFVLPFMMRHLNMGKQQRTMNKELLDHSAAYLIVTTAVDDKRAWLSVGQLYARIAVEAQRLGVKQGLLAAAIECKDYYKKLQSALGTQQRPQLFMRLGYTENVPPPSPRLPLKKLLKKRV